MNNHPRQTRRGFTLIESMASVVILATSASLASFLIIDSIEGYTEAGTSAQLHAELSVGLDRAVREIRKIELDSAAATPPGPNITDVTATTFQWLDSAGLSYQIALNGGGDEVQLEVASAVMGTNLATLITDVTSLSVQCYDKNNGAIVPPITADDCDAIRRVELNITVARYGVSETLKAKVFIRSTMDGAQ